MEFVTLLAIFLGPIFAVLTSIFLQKRGERRERRMEIFRTLMRTRRMPMSPDHVGALNLVEIEFANDKKVTEKFKALIDHFGTAHARLPNETVGDTMEPSDRSKAEEDFHRRIFRERQELLADLLHAIARNLGFKIEQLEIFKGGYTPQGWEDVEMEQAFIRRFIVDLALGRRAVPVAVLSLVDGAKNGTEN